MMTFCIYLCCPGSWLCDVIHQGQITQVSCKMVPFFLKKSRLLVTCPYIWCCRPFGRLWWDETVPTVVTRAEPHNQVSLITKSPLFWISAYNFCDPQMILTEHVVHRLYCIRRKQESWLSVRMQDCKASLITTDCLVRSRRSKFLFSVCLYLI